MLKDTYLKNSQIPLRYLRDIILMPSAQDEQTFDELKAIKDNITEFVKNGENVLICSNGSGNGKTTWATKLLKAYVDKVENLAFSNDTPVLFVNVNSFLNEKKLAISDQKLLNKVNEIEKAIRSAKIVVFDDIADKALSEYDMNTMYYWIDYRTSNLKSCIFTTNQLPNQLKTTLSGKIYSRVVNYSKIMTITDGDHRCA